MKAITLKQKILIGAALLILFEIAIAYFYVKPDMSGIGAPREKLEHVFGYKIPFNGVNIRTMQMTWLVMAVLVTLAVVVNRSMKKYPGRLQAMMELFVAFCDDLTKSTLGPELGRFFMPYFGTMFLFVLCSNYLGIIPLPFMEEPTRDLNTTLGLGTFAFIVSHSTAIKVKGLKNYIMGYFEPVIEVKGMKIPNVAFFPLNVVGELAKVVSHSFRLFGNITGGGVIFVVISNLIYHVGLPIGMNMFFGLFSGAVQAFVFSMLAVVYIGVLCE